MITVTYTFKGENLPKFIKSWNEFKELNPAKSGYDIISYFQSIVPQGYNLETYVLEDYESDDSYVIIMEDIDEPHYQIWNGMLLIYELTMEYK